jgi:hypothetical protein
MDLISVGGVNDDNFVVTLGLLGRRPLFVDSGGASVIGVARSSTSIRSAIISTRNNVENHQTLHFLVLASY